jgi:hypothetical protein
VLFLTPCLSFYRKCRPSYRHQSIT